MNKRIVGFVLMIALLASITGVHAADGWCGFTIPEETHSCSGGEWTVCTTRFITMASGHGSGWVCLSVIECKSVGPCETVAEAS